ncbi:MAG TPA: nucleotide exchange factor GrpE [Anaeromyxobacteraceae bacterium]|nr:nucleotide exchange factor GrpE [Anaeromyxobacteraceae bacterium]
MSDDQRNGSGEPEVKVTDRRRFTADGEPSAADRPAQGAAPPPAPADERDERLARQDARIDELTRAYAALLEEGKAARSRLEREKARVLEAERAQVAQALLESADELERALAAAGGATGPLVDGVRLSLAALQKRVAELGAVRIAVLGERFDPRLAEAIDLVPVADPSQDERVVQEVRAGYRIGERVLRPARVRVGRLASA